MCLERQSARGALLRLLLRLVAHGVLATVCLRRLVACLAPPPGPPAPCEGDAGPWQPAAADALVQDEVVAALMQVRCLAAPPGIQPEWSDGCSMPALQREWFPFHANVSLGSA